MTEQEWLDCKDPNPMLTFLQGKMSDRKLRLFACACCRRIWHLLGDERSREAVLASECYADGTITKTALARARVRARPKSPGAAWAAWDAAREKAFTAAVRAFPCAAWSLSQMRMGKWVGMDAGVAFGEQGNQARLLRDIAGNPFRPVILTRAWQTPTVAGLAQSMYEDRSFQAMPPLADALEEAGCTEEAILKHCREPGEHVRGCWVVDLLLGQD